VRRANDYIREALQEIDAAEVATPPRAERLHELEASPPDWLLHEIGRPPRSRGGRQGFATRLLDWRRAALSIDDYRKLTGFDSQVGALGIRPREEVFAEAYDAAVHTVEIVNRERLRCHELSR
jgi:hypothetical protein